MVHAIFLAKTAMAQKSVKVKILDSQDLIVDSQSHPKPITPELYAANFKDSVRRVPYVAKNTATDNVT